MADDERTTPGAVSVADALAREPFRFDFFQALRRLDCEHRDKPRLGEAQLPAHEAVRLGQEASLGFAPAPLARFEPGDNQEPSRLFLHFFGMLGPNGPLPLHLTEYARQRQQQNDVTFSRFLDLFHHRMASLFYRAWANSQPTVARDRPHADRFMTYLGAVLGLGMPSLRGRDELPDELKLFFAGRLAAQPRNAEGLQAMIGEYFGMPAQIEQFVGEWVDIPREHAWSLGGGTRRGAFGIGLLGQSTIVGTRIWSRQHKFRVVLGPLTRDQFRKMLPGGASLSRLRALVFNYLGHEWQWDLRLILRQEAILPMQLGKSAQLGRTTWLVGDPASGKARSEDLIFDPQRSAENAEAAPSAA
jgi:type VI secretion system protein ImpH